MIQLTELSILELFRWKNGEEVEQLMNNPKKREKIEEEMGDVFFALARLSQKYNIDLSDALKAKIEKNNVKYPVEKSRGSCKKYNEED